MQTVLIISVFTLTTAATVPSNWQLSSFDGTGDSFVEETRPVIQGETFPRAVAPGYSTNAFSGKQNQPTHLPVNNIQWVPIIPTSNPYTFLTSPVKVGNENANNENNPDFVRALNNFFNIQSNVPDVNGVTRKANIQQGPSQQVQHNQRNLNNNPTFQHNQVQFIPYSTRDINSQGTGNSQSRNVKQRQPQVNIQNTAAPFIDLDFNLNNPFGHNHHGNVQQNNIRRKPDFNTNQPGVNFDLGINAYYPHNHPVISTANQHNTQIPQIPLPPINTKNIREPNRLKTTQSSTNSDFDLNNPFYKNYRDDPQYDRETIPKVERLKSEKAPISTHEYPAEVPTRPIYPGEGQWAKFGGKHKPFIGRHIFTPLEESKTVPEGYDIFLDGHRLFDLQNHQFGKKLQEFPQKYQLGTSLPSGEYTPRYEPLKSKVNRHRYNPNKGEDDEDENRKNTFKPSRLYAQVRHSDEEKHLPSTADENGKLKELIKDTKVHTIYSEEGYEDSAYDHAGHEKKAENAEDYEKDKKRVEQKEQRSNPVKKYHLPREEDVDTQEDLQNLKRELLNDDDTDDDSETSSTQHSKAYVSKEKPPKKVYSAKTKDASKYKVKKHDFMESTGSSPVATIVKGAGDTEIEISSEVKLIVQPNNVTKAHKFVKIYPKFHTEDKSNKNLDGKIIKTTSTEIPFTTITPTKFEDIFPVEIPATTQATTAIPKIRTPLPSGSRRRRKRFTKYFPKIEVDTDFIDKINHTLPKKKDIREKYPYYYDYNKIGLHADSPLRYAEDLTKIPVKTDGTLAFYEQADKKKECSEVDEVVDPVPDRINKADKKPEELDGSTDVAELAESPRLTQLGDKIDCFKAKYFGENPFDNPLFTEKVVGPVKPIFEEFDGSTNQKINKAQTKKITASETLRKRNSKRDVTSKGDVEDQENDIESDTLEKNYKNFIKNDLHTYSLPLKWEANNDNSPEDIDLHRDEEVTDVEPNSKEVSKELNSNDITEESQEHTLPPASLITTPKYTISLKPKHIYDQIELLQYLPIDEYPDITTEKVTEKTDTHKPEDKILSNKDSTTSTEENKFDKSTKSKSEKTVTSKVNNDGITEPIKETTDELKDKGGWLKNEESNKTDINESKYIRELEETVDKNVTGKNEHGTEFTNKTSKTVRDKPEQKNQDYLEKISEEGTQKTFTREPQESISERRTARVLNNPKNIAKEENSGEYLPEAESLIGRVRTKGIIRKPLYEIFDINDYLPKIHLPQPPFTDIILTHPIRPKVNIPQEQTFAVFDVNKYLPTPFPVVTQSTVLPKYKVVSEVFYKDDIKPNEQLNVFTDVFNNIKNSPEQQQDVIHDASEQISVTLKVDELNNDKNLKNIYMASTSTTTTRPTRYRNRHKNNHLRNPINSAKKGITGRRPYYETDRIKRGQTTTTIRPNVLGNLHKNHQMYDAEKPVNEEETLINHTNEEENQSTTNKVAVEPISMEQEESTKIMGLVPPDPHIYKTIYHPKRDNTLDLANDGLIEERKLNKYIVPGMKPPSRQRVYDYSDYLTVNHIRSSPGKSKRSKRSAARPAYAEVSRNRNKQEETNTEKDSKKDDDDYVPHRQRNYHYDEKTGKIVYDKKPEKEESEEVDYIEVVEETPPSTTSKPKQNPIFATATPPPDGKSYIDFVKLLKSATNYHEIPDPTTTEKGKESTTEAIPITTLKPVSTTPPEFLSILAKIRNDSNYKFIEEKKKTKATTTVKPIEEEEDIEESEESQIDNIKNLPGSPGVVDGENFKLFDITDFLPNVKNYMPKTAVDVSKYKSIQRPSTRQNNEEKAEVKETPQDKVVSPATRSSRRGGSTTTTEASATLKPTRGLLRKRTTTSSSVITTQEGVFDTPTPESGGEVAHHDKARRTYRRRNPRIKSTATVTSTEKYLTEDVDDTTKIILRRSERDSSVLMLNIDNNNKETSDDYVDQSKPLNRVDDQGTYEKVLDKNVDDKNDDPTPVVVQQVVEIIKNYDKTKKHGGNYREEDEVASENRLRQSQQNKILPYEGKKEDVEVFKKYDKAKKHGGNYRGEHDGEAQSTDKQTGIIEEENDNSRVEVFKNYDKTKKHGGNYKSEDEIQHISEPLYEESRVVTPTRNQIDTNGKQAKDVEVFKDYDKNKKHGGNYIHENDFLRKQKAQNNSKPVDLDTSKDVEIFNNYDKTKKHGGNYRPESEAILDTHNEETSYGNSKLPQKRDQENKEGQPLPLTILKPEFFYTDPKLPVVINGLKIVNGMSPEELEEIVASAEAESIGDDFDDGNYKAEKEDRKDEVGVVVVVPENSPPEISTTTTKPLLTTTKPLFIKDPSKRLYYYAPLR